MEAISSRRYLLRPASRCRPHGVEQHQQAVHSLSLSLNGHFRQGMTCLGYLVVLAEEGRTWWPRSVYNGQGVMVPAPSGWWRSPYIHDLLRRWSPPSSLPVSAVCFVLIHAYPPKMSFGFGMSRRGQFYATAAARLTPEAGQPAPRPSGTVHSSSADSAGRSRCHCYLPRIDGSREIPYDILTPAVLVSRSVIGQGVLLREKYVLLCRCGQGIQPLSGQKFPRKRCEKWLHRGENAGKFYCIDIPRLHLARSDIVQREGKQCRIGFRVVGNTGSR